MIQNNRHIGGRQPLVDGHSKQSYLVHHNGILTRYQKRLTQDLDQQQQIGSGSSLPIKVSASRPELATMTTTTKTASSITTTNIGITTMMTPFKNTLDALIAPQQASQSNPFIMDQLQCESPTRAPMNCTSQELQEQILDFSPTEINFADIQKLWVSKDFLDILFRVTFVAPIVLLGIVGNLTIIYSMFKFKPFRSKPTNIFILNMAIADLLTTMVCPTAALFTDIYQFYVLGSFICRFEGFVKITCLLVSSYSLIILSSDWLLCVVKPCRTRMTIKQSWLALATIWFLSVLMASPLFVWRKLRRRIWKDLVEVWCCEMIHYTKYYWVVITFFLIYLPTFFMTVVLVIILAQMDKFEAKLRRSRSPTSSQSNCSLTIHIKYRRRIVKILFTYLLTSIVCWTPLQFTIIYRHFRSEAIPSPWFFELAFFAQLSASLTAAMNPIIFGFLSQPFRRMVTKSLMFKFLDKVVGSKNGARSSADNNLNARNETPAKNQNNRQQQSDKNGSRSQQKNQQLQHIVRVQKHPKPTLGHQMKSGSNRLIVKSPATKSGGGGGGGGEPGALMMPGGSFKNVNSASNGCASPLDHSNNKRVSFKTFLNSELQTQNNEVGCDNSAFKGSPSFESKLGIIRETQILSQQQLSSTTTTNNKAVVGPQQNGNSISTTSFMHPEQIIRRPISFVSMDSINIEENLGPTASGDGEANS